MGRPTTAVMWFRRDLRLADNPALVAASAAADRVLGLFVFDDLLLRRAGPNRVAFLLGCLDELAASMDGSLVVRSGDPVDEVVRIAREADATGVWCAEDFGPYGTARDTAVEDGLRADGLDLHRVGSSYAVPPATLFTRGGGPFRVFTPYARAWRQHGWVDPVEAPRGIRWATGLTSVDGPASPAAAAVLPPPGEAAARGRLQEFVEGPIHDYAEHRDRPALDGTSRLSPYLKWGCLHPRQALAGLAQGEGERSFATELAWRDFYADVLFHRPDTVRHSFNPAMAAMEVDDGPRADDRFAAWCEGRTGFPIVDAGMRQLLAEGWMHNRVRMIVASFLVKDLHVDWTRGASWFMHHLVDGDLASNQHGWQWVAGTGTDAAPYFRVFNPTAQGRRFDPEGEYIRRWVPEMGAVEGGAVHEPTAGAGGLFQAPTDYPAPIVDHATERDEALHRYRQVRSRG